MPCALATPCRRAFWKVWCVFEGSMVLKTNSAKWGVVNVVKACHKFGQVFVSLLQLITNTLRVLHFSIFSGREVLQVCIPYGSQGRWTAA